MEDRPRHLEQRQPAAGRALRATGALPRFTDTPTVLWTRRKGHRWLGCSVQLHLHGLEIPMAINGRTPSHSRTFQTQDELLAWTAEERTRCLAEGWS